MTTVIDEISTNDRSTKGSGSDRSEFNYTAHSTQLSSHSYSVSVDLISSHVISRDLRESSGGRCCVSQIRSQIEIDRSVDHLSIMEPNSGNTVEET